MTRYTPYADGEAGFRIGLKPLDPHHWIEPDERAAEQFANKAQLLSERRDDVVATLPELTELTLDTCGLRRERLAEAAAGAKQLRAVTLRWMSGLEVALVRELWPQATVTTHGL